MIWNPSTRLYKTLPLGSHTDPCGITIGFGWEAIDNDYKVVKIGFYYGEFAEWAEVWTANLDSWKEIKVDRKFCLITNCCDVIVKRFSYFFAQDSPGNDGITLVASFDMRAEVLQVVSVPDSLLERQYDFNAMNWKETFALVARVSPEPRKIYQVWTMENSSVGKEHWNKKFTLEPDHIFYRTVNSVNGKFILRRHRTLILYDVENRDTKTVGRVKFPVLGAHYYVESLMSIKGFNHFGDDARRRWNEQELELNTGHVSIETKS